MPKVFIIILNWNGWKDTLECLKSLKHNNYPCRIVVVDNGSTDESVERLEDIEGIDFLSLKSNWGFSGGNNFGIKYALREGADYVLLLNNDTIVDKNFLKELMREAEKNPRAGLLGAKIYYHDEPEKIWFAGGEISFLGKGTHIGVNEIDKGQYDQVKEVEYITGCCLLVKKEVTDKIGFLDEDYFLYYEDTDYSWRARKAGYDCLFVPRAKIWHKCSAASVEGSASYIYYSARNRLLLLRKNAPIFVRIILPIFIFWKTIKQFFKLLFVPEKRIWSKNILLGIKDYYLKRTGKYENWH